MANAINRMEIYMGLAVAFERPRQVVFSSKSEGSLMKILSQQTRDYLLSFFPKPASALFSFIESKSQNCDPDFWQDFEIEYNRLFVGPFSPRAHPYESTYINPKRQVFDECVLRICHAYHQEDLALKSNFHDLPDHVVTELEYMAILCERELEARQNSKSDKTLDYLLRQYDFLMKHLSVWISEFCCKIESNADSPFYLSLAAILRDFIAEDTNNLRNEIHKQEAKVFTSPASAVHRNDLISAQQRKTERQKDSYILELKAKDCILCGVCVSICPTKAFQIKSNQHSIRLLFNMALCDNCEQCLALCPGQAITWCRSAEFQKAVPDHAWVEVATAKSIVCSNCGKVYSPDKIQKRVLASFSNAEFGPEFFEMLSICTTCKGERIMKSYKSGIHNS